MSILKECLALSHHALESFIIEQSKTDVSYYLPLLSKHPNFTTLSDKVKQIWNIFSNETYQTAKGKNLLTLLDQRQINQLRKLSVLSLIETKQQIRLDVLCNDVELGRIALYRILTQMSTKDLISIKINEKDDMLYILASKRRLQSTGSKELIAMQCEQRLRKMLQDNMQLVRNLNKSQLNLID